ncbi:MAG TPA: glycoside hydrolase family 43 protein [Armatimonadota bacterium]|nr:glycoside hydrolase family 43 protein [Armatimonadota bacterium]
MKLSSPRLYRSILFAPVALAIFLSTACIGRPAAPAGTGSAVPIPVRASAATFTNPILDHAPDPWVIWRRGKYYMLCTTGRNLRIHESTSLTDIKDGKSVVVWRAPAQGPNSQQVWAPELHFIHGHWYLYYCADDGRDADHRIFVLESATDDPLGAYIDRGKVADATDQWAIDPTVLQLKNGADYLLWSGRDHWPADQSIYIARLSNPWTITGPRAALSRPTYPWERHGWPVNEGPEILQHHGRIFVVYSASGYTTPDYCLGLLTHTSGDVMDPKTWTKSPVPVFQEYDGPDGGVYGPGHCSFTRSPDGKQDWIVYHGRDTSANGGGDRSSRAQPFTWNPDGTPHFGHPIPDGEALPIPSGEVPILQAAVHSSAAPGASTNQRTAFAP